MNDRQGNVHRSTNAGIFAYSASTNNSLLIEKSGNARPEPNHVLDKKNKFVWSMAYLKLLTSNLFI